MMSRLITATQELCRRLFASLPFPMRLASVIQKIANRDMTAKAYGPAFFALFRTSGVKDVPAPDKASEVKFGHEMVSVAGSSLLGHLKTDENIEDLVANVYMKFKAESHHFSGKDFAHAKHVVFATIKNMAISKSRLKSEQGGGRNVSINDDELSPAVEKAVSSPGGIDHTPASVWKDLAEGLRSKMPTVMHDLHSASPYPDHKDLDQYFDLLLDGHSDRQIVMQQLLPFMKNNPAFAAGEEKAYKNWHKTYLPKYQGALQKVLKHHLGID